MAVEISEKFLRSLNPPHLLHLHLMIILYRPILAFRRLSAKLFKQKKNRIFVNTPKDLISSNLENQKSHYGEKGWAYVENIFDEEFHRVLIDRWPSNIFFEPPASITKGYNIGFKWNRGWNDPEYIGYFPVLKKLFEFIRSEEWSRRLEEFTNSPHRLHCNSFIVNTSYPGSSVVPHKDSPFPEEAKPYINFVFFVDGTGGKNTGALALSRDNELKDLIFEPPSVRNSCIIYDIDANLFHGFHPIQWGKFRWAITASFCREGYISR